MKAYGLSFFFLLFLYLSCFSTALNSGVVSTGSRNTMNTRKLKGSMEKDAGGVSLEDYRPIDPVPSCTASIKPAPIQHGTPLMPYIPEPSPSPPPPEHAEIP